jgi:hypothetical protein
MVDGAEDVEVGGKANEIRVVGREKELEGKVWKCCWGLRVDIAVGVGSEDSGRG